MPHYYIFNQWVKIPSTQDGENTTKCLHCGKEFIKNTNESFNEDLLEGKSGASSRGNSSSNGVC